MAIATFAMFTFWILVKPYLLGSPPGDYEVRQGDILLGDKKYDEAVERFNAALEIMPNHRGALMGRAIAHLQSGHDDEAEAEFTYLIDYLTKNLVPDDATGVAVLAGAYANRGILYDRTGRYNKALADYREALKIDEDAVKGPSLIDKVLYVMPKAATVRKRAEYLEKQLALPADQRLLSVPKIDKEQRMYKP
jgi:tetratricopeptide (TPR) repeat protein